MNNITELRLPNAKIKTFGATLLCSFTVLGLLAGCAPKQKIDHTAPLTTAVEADKLWPHLDIEVKSSSAVEARVAALLATMTLEQKVAQMIQPEIRDITVDDMRKYGFGSFLNGGGAFPNNNKHATPADWIQLAEDMYQASIDDSLDGSSIPTMWGTDAVHGHNNVIGATLFPHNIGLGAMNNPKLIEKIASITAKEVMVTGIDWVFAPTVAVVRDDRWGRTYEGYSEDPDIVRVYASSVVKGLQGSVDKDFLGEQRVISTVKHFLGDGGTAGGDDQGNNLSTEQALYDIHAQGYVGGLTAGAQSVMASFNSWHGKKNHGNKYLLTDVLKERMGFDGFVVGDWNGHGQIKGCTNESCPQAINAGLDIFMVPTAAWKPLYENTISQVKNGEISLERIDDAVSRILRVKVRAGIFDKPSPAGRALSGRIELIGSAEHRAVARQAVRQSLVLLKNKNNILPLSPRQNILVTGDGADNIGKQAGGWTITWQGTNNYKKDFPGGSSIYDGILNRVTQAQGHVELSADGKYSTKPDVAIVVFGEEPYAEGVGDIDNLEYQPGIKQDLALLNKLKADDIPVVALFISGRPLWVNAELNASDAFVAVWLPGSEGVGIADVIFSKMDGEINYNFTGRLSYSWPAFAQQSTVNRFDDNYQPLLPYGFGLKYGDKNVLGDRLPVPTSINTSRLQTLTLFESSVKAPWQMVISDGESATAMTSSVVGNDVVDLRTIDRAVQEDARKAVFNGKGQGSISFISTFPTDLSAYTEAGSSLEFTVRRSNNFNIDNNDAVYLSMSCGTECNSKVDISQPLSVMPSGKWHTMSVDLACFKNNGADMTKILSPFSLQTSAALTLDFSDIFIKTTIEKPVTISCQ